MKVQFIWTSDTPEAEELFLKKVEVFPGQLEEIADIKNTFFQLENGFFNGNYIIPAFVCGECARDKDLFEDETMAKLIGALCDENATEIVLVCDYKFFKECLYFSKEEEMKVKMSITKERGILHYAVIGAKQCALLVSYDIYSE